MKINCELTEKVVSKLQENNIMCYLVGGYVRDSLLGLPSKDIDIELHNTTAEQAYEIISSVTAANYYGNFGVIALEEANTEFAVARSEVKKGNSHTDFEVHFITNGDLKLAASRRDFTINSLMYDLQTKQLIDFFNGQEDLKNKILRHVSPRFSEDPLRILRGLKFMARYDLTMDSHTNDLCKEIIEDLNYLPKSRIENEISAIFTAPHFLKVAPILTEYLNLLFKQDIKKSDFTCEKCREIDFFQQFPNYKTVIKFCYEQKRVRKNFCLILDNYEQILNHRTLSGSDLYLLFKKLTYVTDYAYSLNPKLECDYNYYLQLCQKYNGDYFINKGISGKEIAKCQAQKIGGKLDELQDSNKK